MEAVDSWKGATPEARIALLVDVAQRMGAEVIKRDPEMRNGEIIARREGREFWLEFSTRERTPRVVVSGRWPMYSQPNARDGSVIVTPRDAGAIERGESSPEAAASADRGPEAIARDFLRRFWPEFSRCYDACAEKVRSLIASSLTAEAEAAAFAQAVGERYKPGESSSLGTSWNVWTRGMGTVRFDAYGGKATATVGMQYTSMSPDQALRIWKILHESEADDANG